MNCRECDGYVEPTHRFCNWCGARLNVETPIAGAADNGDVNESAEIYASLDPQRTIFPTPLPTPFTPPQLPLMPPQLPLDLEPLEIRADESDVPHVEPATVEPAAVEPATVEPAAVEPAAVESDQGEFDVSVVTPVEAASDAVGFDGAPDATETASDLTPEAPTDFAPDTAPDDIFELSHEPELDTVFDTPAPVEDLPFAQSVPSAPPVPPSYDELEWEPISVFSPAYRGDEAVDPPTVLEPTTSFGAPEPDISPELTPAPESPKSDGVKPKAAKKPSRKVRTASAPAELPATTVVPSVADEPDTARRRFTVTPLLVVALLGAALAVTSMFMNVITIASDSPIDVAPDNPYGFQLGQWTAGDLAGNLPIAGIIIAAGMLIGAIVAATGRRWGGGLAGGSGAAALGLAALTLGVAQFPMDAAHRLVGVPSDQQYVLAITRDVGYWLQVATAAIGVIVLWVSTSDARSDRRRSLNPWTAALGALATLIAALGPTLPVNQALFSDNWYLIDAITAPSQMLMIGRLVQIAVFGITGVVGFLMVSRYGLGLVFGGTLPVAWLTASAALDITGNPVGFGFANPGATTMQVHGVTIIGVAATLAAALIACAAVLAQNTRHR